MIVTIFIFILKTNWRCFSTCSGTKHTEAISCRTKTTQGIQ